jgi:formate hydrogenlyase subunit 3/multisubunit Na+/H+ antiporter MnhD subunit
MLVGLLCIIIASLSWLFNPRDTLITLYQLNSSLIFSLHLDRLSSLFIALVSIVSACVVIYSFGYVEHSGSGIKKQLVIALLALFILSMIMVVAADNTFTFLFFWEVMSVSSFMLVMYDGQKPEIQKAGIFYFVMTQLSTLFLFAGFLLLYSHTGQFGITAASGLPIMAGNVTFVLLFIGFGTKAGLIPLHKWLPYAHSSAPSNVSALMSGVMLKVAVYGMCRFLTGVLEPQFWWGLLLLVFGTISAVLGVIYALKEHDIKKLLAYHSIENIGIIVIGLGLYIIFSYYGLELQANLSLVGALFHTFNHALFKSLLFMTAGSVIQATGTRNIEKMGGLVKTMPVTAILFLIGSCAISALPPLNGFASEVMIFLAYLHSFELNDALLKIVMVAGVAAFALTSALAAACFVKAFGIVFLARPRSEEAAGAREPSPVMLAGPAILAILCFITGIFSLQILQLAGIYLPVPDMLPIGIVVLLMGLLFALIIKVKRYQVRITETWSCGIDRQTPAMEYTASGFSEPIVTIFRIIFRTQKTNIHQYYDRDECIIRSRAAGIRTINFFEDRIYMPVGNMFKNRRMGFTITQ